VNLNPSVTINDSFLNIKFAWYVLDRLGGQGTSAFV